MIRASQPVGLWLPIAACFLVGITTYARAELPDPVLTAVVPAGGQAGTSVTVTVEGSSLEGLRDLRTTVPNLTVKKLDGNRFTLTIPSGTTPGVYDLRAVGTHGMSSPRAFFVSNRVEVLEKEPNDELDKPQAMPLDAVVNGRIEKPGDIDCYQFAGKAGQRVVLECWADRIDSQLRAVLELYDSRGKRLAVNRGYSGIDPLIDFRVPEDGSYVIKLFDLSYLGGPAHFYRLDIDTKPRIEFALPSVVTRGTTTRVTLFGRNLTPQSSLAKGFDRVEVDVAAPRDNQLLPLPLRAAQLGLDAFPCYYPGGHAPVMLGLTDVPVVIGAPDNRVPERPHEVAAPCEITGQLLTGDETHWFALRVRRGEVFYLEAFGERIGSAIDLDVTVLDPTGQRELLKLSDHLENLGGYRFPTNHLDPSGRWVAPADGRYLILLRSLIGNSTPDPRRIYRLAIRREEPDFHLALVSHRLDQPAGLNIRSGGREMAEVIAIRRRGMTGPIRLTAENLPPGIQCPTTWIGPGQDRVPLVLTSTRKGPPFAGGLSLVGHAESGTGEIVRPVRGGTMVWPGRPIPSGRLTQEIPLATAPDSQFLLTATPSEAVAYQDTILDFAVDIQRPPSTGPATPVLLNGVGLPKSVGNPTASIPPGKSTGWISFRFPSSLPPGPYTVAVQAEAGPISKTGKGTVTLVSNPIVVHVRPARMAVELDPRAPRRIGRGKTIHLYYTVERKHGFLGKVHTDLVAPGGVVGLRGRGVTFTSQQDSGEIQVVASDDAPLGRQAFLRLEAVGTVEDQPVFKASCLVDLEITE